MKAEVEEGIELLKRMTDGQAWETIKANFHMACKETVGRRKEAEEERGADLLQPFDEEILAEVKQQEGANPNDEQAIDDSNIMGDPTEAKVIIPGTELNIDGINQDLLSTIQGI